VSVLGFVKKEGSSWYFQAELGVDPHTGKRKRKKKRGFKTKREAEKALSQVEAEVTKGTYLEPSTMAFKDYLEQWFKGKQTSLGPQSNKVYRGNIDFRIIPKLGHIPLCLITPLVIQNYVNELKEEGLANATISKLLKMVKSSLDTAKDLELIPKNPAEKIKIPVESTSVMNVWNQKEVKKFLTFSRSNLHFLVFHLALYTGMRQGEILGLRWEDVNFENGTISIRQTLSHDGKTFLVGAKTKTSIRTITLAEETLVLLKNQKLKFIKQKLVLGSSFIDNDLVNYTTNGKPLNPSNIRRAFLKLIEVSDVPKIRFHDLRHTHATLLISNGTNIKVVAERLGHSNVKITLDCYYHVMPNMQKQVANQLSSILEM
jgi:integrase